MEKFKECLSLFAWINTAVCIVSATYITIFCGAGIKLSVGIIWQILIASGICAVGSPLLPLNSYAELSKRKALLHMLAHFLYINIVIFTCGYFFEWFYLSNFAMIMCMEVAIVAVYVLVTAASYAVDSRLACKLNHRLQERNKEKDD